MKIRSEEGTSLNLIVLGLAHLPTAETASHFGPGFRDTPVENCAYTTKVARFIRMMKGRGHKVTFVGLEGSATEADDHIEVLSEYERNQIYGPLDQFRHKFFVHDGNDPAYKLFTDRAIAAIRDLDPPQGTLLCNPMGNYYQRLMWEVAPPGKGNVLPVESGIGYYGILDWCFHIFESYTWMAHVYGSRQWATGPTAHGRTFHYDTAIPNFYDPDHYPVPAPRETNDDFLLMVCRQIDNKGIWIGKEIAEATKTKLIMVGQPSVKIESPYVEQLGVVDEPTKLDLMSRAKALLCPTKYQPPFEGVHVEAMLCGTPPITTDWGVFTESIPHNYGGQVLPGVHGGQNGYRCSTLKQFVWAVNHIDDLTPAMLIRSRAERVFGLDAVGLEYEAYFRQLGGLYGMGWAEK